MKRIFYLSVLSIVFIACNSTTEREMSITIGDTKNMVITEINETFKGVFVGVGEVNTRTFSFDIDNNGKNDFTFYSSVDTINNGDWLLGDYHYRVGVEGHGLKIRNDYKTISQSQNSYIGDTVIGMYIKHIYHIIHSDCEGTSAQGDEKYNYYVNYEINDKLTSENFENLSSTSGNYLNLYQSYDMSVFVSSYNVEFFLKDFSCANAPQNKSFFLGIQDVSNEVKLGWIELEILENNTIHLNRAALQE